MSVIEDLRAQPLLEYVGDERLQALAGQVTAQSFAAGDVVFGDEEKLDSFVLLVAGRISTAATLDGAELDAGFEHQAPTYLGAIQLLSDGLQRGIGRAVEPTRVLLLGVEHFFELLRCEPEVARTIFARFAPVFSKLEGQRADREKLVALGGLAAGLAHELNNPAASAARGAADLGDALTELEDAPRALVAAGAAPWRSGRGGSSRRGRRPFGTVASFAMSSRELAGTRGPARRPFQRPPEDVRALSSGATQSNVITRSRCDR